MKKDQTSGSTYDQLYWYGSSSDPLIETDLAGVVTDEYIFFGGKRVARRQASGTVHYYFSDHLGSSRVVTSDAGAILDDSDYYPFGGERAVVNNDPNPYKFTGKERDTESGLDFFIARYYSSQQGRFLSPDEFTGGPVDAFSSNDPLPPRPLPYADITNPQSLNKYAYTFNNPLRYTDPNGHCADDCKNIKVEAKVTSQARIIQGPRSGQNDVARAGGTIQYTLTYKNKPLANTLVLEKVQTTTTVNGHQVNPPVVTGAAITNDQGQIQDTVAITNQQPNPGDTGSNRAALDLVINTFTVEATQTLYFKSPTGASCECTQTRSLTNVGPNGEPSANYRLTQTAPAVQTARPAPQEERKKD